jgi:hypothetical protein
MKSKPTTHNEYWHCGYKVGYASEGIPLGVKPQTDWHHGYIAGWKAWNRKQSMRAKKR